MLPILAVWVDGLRDKLIHQHRHMYIIAIRMASTIFVMIAYLLFVHDPRVMIRALANPVTRHCLIAINLQV